jgi:hypothetical protein
MLCSEHSVNSCSRVVESSAPGCHVGNNTDCHPEAHHLSSEQCCPIVRSLNNCGRHGTSSQSPHSFWGMSSWDTYCFQPRLAESLHVHDWSCGFESAPNVFAVAASVLQARIGRHMALDSPLIRAAQCCPTAWFWERQHSCMFKYWMSVKTITCSKFTVKSSSRKTYARD